jgi:type IX secretion system PorP/SprF family membrane protein
MKKSAVIIVVLVISFKVYSQPINRISNYLQNQIFFNPGATGMYDQQLNVGLINRFQWTGVKGAPIFNTLWVDYKVKNQGLSFGLIADRSSRGATVNTGASFSTAYSVLLSKKTRLSMGLRFGFDQMIFNPSQLDNVFDDGDQVLGTNAFRQTFFKIGGGFQLRSSRFHLGLASSDLYINDKHKYFNKDTLNFFKRPRNYILNTGYKILLSDSYTLIPSAIAYVYSGTKSIAGAGLTFEIKDYFWAGTNYYSNKTETFTVGTYISSRIRFIYSFQWSFGKSLGVGSHELNLLFRMDKVGKKGNK